MEHRHGVSVCRTRSIKGARRLTLQRMLPRPVMNAACQFEKNTKRHSRKLDRARVLTFLYVAR